MKRTEDRIVVDEVALLRQAFWTSSLLTGGSVMVDVGAHTGASLRPFLESGWDVWAFEPNPVMHAGLIKRFGRWPTLRLFPVAVSDEIEDAVPFFVSDLSTGISSLVDFHDSHEPLGEVATRRLDQLPLDVVDFLKIDVEGFDRHVFRSRGDLVPRTLVTEFEDNKTMQLGYSSGEYAEELVAAGYTVWISEWFPIERYGGDHRWRSLYRYDGTAPSSDSWGNFIGLHESNRVDSDVAERALRDALTKQAGVRF